MKLSSNSPVTRPKRRVFLRRYLPSLPSDRFRSARLLSTDFMPWARPPGPLALTCMSVPQLAQRSTGLFLSRPSLCFAFLPHFGQGISTSALSRKPVMGASLSNEESVLRNFDSRNWTRPSNAREPSEGLPPMSSSPCAIPPLSVKLVEVVLVECQRGAGQLRWDVLHIFHASDLFAGHAVTLTALLERCRAGCSRHGNRTVPSQHAPATTAGRERWRICWSDRSTRRCFHASGPARPPAALQAVAGSFQQHPCVRRAWVPRSPRLRCGGLSHRRFA